MFKYQNSFGRHESLYKAVYNLGETHFRVLNVQMKNFNGCDFYF